MTKTYDPSKAEIWMTNADGSKTKLGSIKNIQYESSKAEPSLTAQEVAVRAYAAEMALFARDMMKPMEYRRINYNTMKVEPATKVFVNGEELP